MTERCRINQTQPYENAEMTHRYRLNTARQDNDTWLVAYRLILPDMYISNALKVRHLSTDKSLDGRSRSFPRHLCVIQMKARSQGFLAIRLDRIYKKKEQSLASPHIRSHDDRNNFVLNKRKQPMLGGGV